MDLLHASLLKAASKHLASIYCIFHFPIIFIGRRGTTGMDTENKARLQARYTRKIFLSLVPCCGDVGRWCVVRGVWLVM